MLDLSPSNVKRLSELRVGSPMVARRALNSCEVPLGMRIDHNGVCAAFDVSETDASADHFRKGAYTEISPSRPPSTKIKRRNNENPSYSS